MPVCGDALPTKYCLMATHFIVFGIEVVFRCPRAVTLGSLVPVGLVQMLFVTPTVFVAHGSGGAAVGNATRGLQG